MQWFFIFLPSFNGKKRTFAPATMKAAHKKLLATCLLLLGATCLSAQVKYGEPVRGVASYYSDSFQGRKMANGQRYNKNGFTCAHLKYPFGTLLRVKNLANGKECVVEVTDRGPYSKKFTIDLSKAAAKYLEYIPAGHTQVEITPLPPEDQKFTPGALEDTDTLKLHLEYEPKTAILQQEDFLDTY